MSHTAEIALIEIGYIDKDENGDEKYYFSGTAENETQAREMVAKLSQRHAGGAVYRSFIASGEIISYGYYLNGRCRIEKEF